MTCRERLGKGGVVKDVDAGGGSEPLPLPCKPTMHLLIPALVHPPTCHGATPCPEARSFPYAPTDTYANVPWRAARGREVEFMPTTGSRSHRDLVDPAQAQVTYAGRARHHGALNAAPQPCLCRPFPWHPPFPGTPLPLPSPGSMPIQLPSM